MKKKSIITLLLVLLLCFSLSSCGNKDKTYEQAQQLEAQHCYIEAIELYESLGNYEDASDRATDLRKEYSTRLTEEINGLKNFDASHEVARNYFNNNRTTFPLLTDDEVEDAITGEWLVIDSEGLEYNRVFNKDGTGTEKAYSDTEPLEWAVSNNNFYCFAGGDLTTDNDGTVWFENKFGNKSKCDYISELRKAYDNVYVKYSEAGTYGVIIQEVMIKTE